MTVGLSCRKLSFSETGALSPNFGTGATSFFGGAWELLTSWLTAELTSSAAEGMANIDCYSKF